MHANFCSSILSFKGFNPSWNESFEFLVDAVEFSHISFYVKEGTGIKDKLDDILEAMSSCKKLQDVKAQTFRGGCDSCPDGVDVLESIAKRGNADLIGQFACPVWALGSGNGCWVVVFILFLITHFQPFQHTCGKHVFIFRLPHRSFVRRSRPATREGQVIRPCFYATSTIDGNIKTLHQ